MYPFERFDQDAKKVLVLAQGEAERSRHSYIGTEHVLLAIIGSKTRAAHVLERLGVEEPGVRATIEKVLGGNERVVVKQMIPTSRVKKVIELAFGIAEQEGSPMVSSEHLLLGLIEEGQGIGAHVLADLGVTADAVARQRAEGS